MTIVAALFSAITLAIMLPSLQPSTQVVTVPSRLDCLVVSAQTSYGGRVAGEDKSSSSEIFIFPHAPRPASTNGDDLSSKLEIVRTMDDGRSWIADGKILEVKWKQWPSFAARIQDGDSLVSLASDKSARGRVTYRGSYITTDGGPAYTKVGSCRFVPEATRRGGLSK